MHNNVPTKPLELSSYLHYKVIRLLNRQHKGTSMEQMWSRNKESRHCSLLLSKCKMNLGLSTNLIIDVGFQGSWTDRVRAWPLVEARVRVGFNRSNLFTLKNGRHNSPVFRFLLFCQINHLDERGQQPLKLVFLCIYEIHENDNFLMWSRCNKQMLN